MGDGRGQRVDESGGGNSCRIEYSYFGMYSLQMWTDVLVEKRGYDQQVLLLGNERDQQLKIALIVVVHEVHRRERTEVELVKSALDDVIDRLITVGRAKGVVAQVVDLLAASEAELPDSVRRVTGADDRTRLAVIKGMSPTPAQIALVLVDCNRSNDSNIERVHRC